MLDVIKMLDVIISEDEKCLKIVSNEEDINNITIEEFVRLLFFHDIYLEFLDSTSIPRIGYVLIKYSNGLVYVFEDYYSNYILNFNYFIEKLIKDKELTLYSLEEEESTEIIKLLQEAGE